MTVTRRKFLATSGAGLGLALTPPRLWASTELSVGQMRIQTLSDGHLTLPPDFIFGPMPKAELAPILQSHDLTGATLTPECNVTLLQDGTNTVLFDVGAGAGFQDSAGELVDALEALDLAPEDITHVVFTHCHPDHLWGVLDEFDDPTFYEAQHMMGQQEWEYWFDPETTNTIQSERTTMAVGARRRMEGLEESIVLFDDGQEILPGVAAHLTPGHTPGHMSFELRSGSDSVLVLGDAIGNHHVAFERPDWQSGSDQDGPLAAQTRQSILDRAVAEKMQLIGYHLPGGGIGRAERAGSTYRFVPDGA